MGADDVSVGTGREDDRVLCAMRTTAGDRCSAVARLGTARVPVGVADPVPTFRRGLLGVLTEAGFAAEPVPQAEVWARPRGRRVLVLTLDLPDDAGAIGRLRAINPDLVVLALIRNATPRHYQEALREGASGAVSWEEPPEVMVDALCGVLEDYCILPIEVVHAMVAGNSALLPAPPITPIETQWLQRLADGATVAELAREASYSEREMFRLLHRLYHRMGVSSRVEAIVTAARSGILDADVDADVG